MKLLVSTLLFITTFISFSQCYECANYRKQGLRTFGPKKAFKQDFQDVKKVKWYKVDKEIIKGVRDYGDSTVTYIYSKNKDFIGKETRYFVSVQKCMDEYTKQKPEIIKCVSPNILPKPIWPLAEKIYNTENLDTLNHVDGAMYWVCDIFKIEFAKEHPIAQKEGNTTFYILNMDHAYSIFKDSGILNHEPNDLDPMILYIWTEELYN